MTNTPRTVLEGVDLNALWEDRERLKVENAALRKTLRMVDRVKVSVGTENERLENERDRLVRDAASLNTALHDEIDQLRAHVAALVRAAERFVIEQTIAAELALVAVLDTPDLARVVREQETSAPPAPPGRGDG